MKVPAFQVAQAYSNAQSALQTQNAGQNQATTTAKAAEKDNAAFEAMTQLANTIAQGETAAQAYMTGGADPHSVVEAMAAAELAVETAVTVRDKVVEAYQELIRMPV